MKTACSILYCDSDLAERISHHTFPRDVGKYVCIFLSASFQSGHLSIMDLSLLKNFVGVWVAGLLSVLTVKVAGAWSEFDIEYSRVEECGAVSKCAQNYTDCEFRMVKWKALEYRMINLSVDPIFDSVSFDHPHGFSGRFSRA